MTNSKWFGTSEADPMADLMRRLAAVESYANDLERKIANFDSPQPISRVDPVTYLNPYEGQRAIDPTDEQHMWYSNGEWRKAGGLALYEIKVFEDTNTVVVGDNKFIWEIPEDLDQAEIISVEGFLTTAGGASTQIAMRLGNAGSAGTDILSTKITIDSGEYNSKDAGVQPVVIANTVVTWGQHLHIDVDASGAGTGLGIIVALNPSPLGSVQFQGIQGPPGGVTQWHGSWATSTSYVAGDIVINNGVVYVATANHTSSGTTQPGVGATWTTVWAPLFQSAIYSGFSTSVHAGGYLLDTGIKSFEPVPFNCTIVEATLLADQAGNLVVDIWKDTYGAYPPTNADSICGSTPPTLTAANKTTDTTLTGWSPNLVQGDILGIVVESVSALNFFTLFLRVLRT